MAYRFTDISVKPIYRHLLKYRLSVISFGQISVIGYRLNLTDMPSLVVISCITKVVLWKAIEGTLSNRFIFKRKDRHNSGSADLVENTSESQEGLQHN